MAEGIKRISMEKKADRVQAELRASLERTGYAGSNPLLVVAVSGGPDSVALLHALVSLQKPLNLRLHVAHLNHDFRGEEAEEDARFVAQMAKSLNLPATVERGDPLAYQREQGISSFEEAARQVRYHFLAKVMRANEAAAVALGHTADDQAETVLMHILRGSGLPGLTGMKEITPWRSPIDGTEATLLRPLLAVTKEETRLYCQREGIPFREDTANLSPRFTRNRLRLSLLPALKEYNPRISEALLRLARNATLEQDYLETELARVWGSVAQVQREQVSLDRRALADLHPFMQALVLRRAYQELTGDTRRLHHAHLNAMVRHIGALPGKLLELPKDLKMLSTYEELLLGRQPHPPYPFPPLTGQHTLHLPSSQPPRLGGKMTTDLPGWQVSVQVVTSPTEPLDDDPLTGWFDASILGEETWVRTRRPGDRFQPAGMNEAKKLQDFLVDAKVPRHWRDSIPLVVCQAGIAWVVGYRLAEWARFKGSVGEALKIDFRPKAEGKG